MRWSALLLVAAVACNDSKERLAGPEQTPTPTPTPTPVPTPVTTTVRAITGTWLKQMATDTTARIDIVMRDSVGGVVVGRRPVWLSSNESIASVDSTGMVVGRAPGVVTISASIDQVTARFDVNVVPAPRSSAITPDSMPLGYDQPIRHRFWDKNGTELIVPAYIRFADTSIVAATSSSPYYCSGTAPTISPCPVRTKKMGSVSVTILTDAGKVFPLSLRVTAPIIDTLSTAGLTTFNIPSVAARSIPVTIIARKYGSAAGARVNAPLVWSSANPAVATVDSTGTVTPHAAGNAVLSAGFGSTVKTVTVHVVAYAAPLQFTSVAAGSKRTCGLEKSGVVYCWGDVSGPAYGDGAGGERLADGTVAPGAAISTVPVAVASSVRFSALARGMAGDLNCAITGTGEAYCWTPTSPPALIAQGLRFRQVVTGAHHACGMTSSGPAVCWGANNAGQLGDGTSQDSDSPRPVAGDPGFTDINAGGDRTCGLTSAGAAYCWGSLGTSGIIYANPVRINAPTTFASVSVGGMMACAIGSDQRLYCWGNSGAGDPFTASRTDIFFGAPYTSVSVGRDRLCATTGQNLFCMPSTGYSLQVSRSVVASSVSSGAATCFVGTDLYVYCLGENELGQAGLLPVLPNATATIDIAARVTGQP